MTERTMFLLEPEALESLLARLDAIDAKLDAVQMQPAPEWLTVKEYAKHVGRDVSTVRRYVASGKLETREECGATMIRVQSKR